MNIQITEKEGVYYGVFEGRLDTVAVGQLTNDIKPLIEHADQPVVLDLAGLEYIASSGLRVFLLLRKESAARGGKITIRNVTGNVEKIFKMVGFYSLFEIE